MVEMDAVEQAVAERDLRRLFLQELGWDLHRQTVAAMVEDEEFVLDAVAEKRGVVVFENRLPKGGLPRQSIRRQIEGQVAKAVREHLIIFTEEDGDQVWQWTKRELGKPSVIRERTIHRGQQGAIVADAVRGLEIQFAEEERLTLTDVLGRLRARFDAERPTKRFYDRFKEEHARLVGAIRGMEDEAQRLWYASVTLNRLMFVYFIQKKGFLDSDPQYLRNRMKRVKEAGISGGFLSFYRAFLLQLFQEGLGETPPRSPELLELIGDVPYLNGGLFSVHQLEEEFDALDIDDHAFESIFDFFDAFDWTIDDRPVSSEREINPDVLGYIFERFINYAESGRREKGAYYTKEDVTGYMTGVAVIPAILDAIVEEHPDTLEQLRHQLSADPERYLYAPIMLALNGQGPAVLDGEAPLAAEARSAWARGVVERLEAGALSSVDDLITMNLDIRQVAQDFLERTAKPEQIFSAWQRLTTIRILDPTCGSGAFLFTALTTLEPLYEAALLRMRGLLDESEVAEDLLSYFAEAVDEGGRHRNQAYWIGKEIVANNLYGVDLLEEATEICKLRLYLRLVAKLNTRDELEPLPDIDFNIRAGNSLVGFGQEQASISRLTATGQTALDIRHDFDEIKEHADEAAAGFLAFREAQALVPPDAAAARRAKHELAKLLVDLREKLDEIVIPENWLDDAEGWWEAHQPLHWYVEFYEALASGGFDVVIGNPPYIKRADIDYEIDGFRTSVCPDVYACVLERSVELLKPGGRMAMIVMLSLAYSSRFPELRALLRESFSRSWYSHFGRIPDYLFSDDVRVRNTIVVGRAGEGPSEVYTTQLHRWLTSYRPYLFETVRYSQCHPEHFDGGIPKASTARLIEAFERARARNTQFGRDLVRSSLHELYYKTNAYNWLAFSLDEPPCFLGEKRVPQSKVKSVAFHSAEERDLAFLLLNGKIMFAWWRVVGGDLDLTAWMFETFPYAVSMVPEDRRGELLELATKLADRLEHEIVYKLNAGKRVGTYRLLKCRDITDPADAIFAELMGIGNASSDIELTYAETVKQPESEEDVEVD